MLIKVFISGVLLFALLACSSLNNVDTPLASAILHDQAYPGFEQVKVETQTQVFALDTVLKNYLDQHILPFPTQKQRMQALAEQLFSPSQVNLLYETQANTVASDTFRQRTANCLSMSILAYVMAEYADLQVTFQDVHIPEFWNVHDDVSFVNGHINLELSAADLAENGESMHRESMIIDFNDVYASNRFSKTQLDMPTVMAMFYNNKGADALLKKDFTQAYAYFRQSVLVAPAYASGWSNLGVLYRLTDHLEWAERAYEAGLQVDPKNRSIWDNQVVLLEMTGRETEANVIRRRIESQRQSNPYYHYYLGQQAYENGDWHQAIRHYKKARKLNHYAHQFYFGLAKAFYELGDIQATRHNLQLAKRYARDRQLTQRYLSKLDVIN
ncbi:tetratricopeptide repeat protein [Neptunicella marina]|uniref:Tetratricopeptide repeat protein n=1 Tax=Neptunicella marina TaxID=2125989 RepID=A0A8J6IXX0_9ALTE|nr:tetratricopeptide repeat protein [Neptunicella marina]MBC3767432.1 tetratricopeptide repeat protein [Neptunicella marina]